MTTEWSIPSLLSYLKVKVWIATYLWLKRFLYEGIKNRLEFALLSTFGFVTWHPTISLDIAVHCFLGYDLGLGIIAMRFSSEASSAFHSGSDSLFVSKTFPINNVDLTNGHYWNMSDYEVLKKYCLTTPWLFCTCKFEFNQRVYYLAGSLKIKNQRSMPSVHSRHTYARPSFLLGYCIRSFNNFSMNSCWSCKMAVRWNPNMGACINAIKH